MRNIARACARPLEAAFRTFLALALCVAFMIPIIPASTAAADTTDDEWEEYVTYCVNEGMLDETKHGDIAVTCSSADSDNVITLELGQTATIVVTPYQHVQYTGCRMFKTGCPEICGVYVSDCFVVGYGCKCDTDPVLVTSTVTTDLTNSAIVSLSDLSVSETLSATKAQLGSTNTASFTVTALTAGTTTLSVEVDGLYYWVAADEEFEIEVVNPNAVEIEDATVTLASSSYTYTGSAIEPNLTVTLDGTTLVEGTDYAVTYADNTDVGTATATVTGMGDYTGTASTTFAITQADIGNATISTIAEQSYTGSAITPDVTLTYNGLTLEEGADYSVSYADNTAVGTATVTFTGLGNFTGTTSTTFDIVMLSVANATITLAATSYTYTGSAIEPNLTVVIGSTTLVAGTDYTVAYTDNVDVGTAAVSVTGTGIYTGSATLTFSITAASISSATVSVEGTYTYTGTNIKPDVTVVLGTTTLVAGTDYTVSYSSNVNAGTATAKVTGTGNYTGTASTKFTIEPLDFSSTAVVGAIADETYTASAIEPELSVANGGITLTAGTDYTVAYTDNVNVGTATATITGTGNYTGSVSATFAIVAADIADATVAAIDNQVRTGEVIEPELTITFADTALVAGTDYNVAYANNVDAGTATVYITGIGNFGGTTTTTFAIVEYDIGAGTLALEPDSATYIGSAFEPTVTVTYGDEALTEDEDYTLAWADADGNAVDEIVAAGTYTVTATGCGSYGGTLSATFSVEQADLADVATMTLLNSSATYTGADVMSSASVKLTDGTSLSEGEDYELTWADSDGNEVSEVVDAGSYTATASGIGNYTGALSATFTVGRVTLVAARASLALSAESADWTGEDLTPSATVSASDGTALVEGTDYTLAWVDSSGNAVSSIVDVGTYTLTATGAGNYSGTLTATFEVCEPAVDISGATVSTARARYLWTGSAVEPAATVTLPDGTVLEEGTDYELSYADNVEAGTATVTATGTGAYTGSASATFEVVLFSDVEEGAWYEEGVYALAAGGYVTGYTDDDGELTGLFGVGDTMKRAQLATVIWRIACPDEYAEYEADYAAASAYDCENTSGLSDVSADSYYTAAVNWAVSEGVITGYTSGKYAGKFRPGASISFQDMCLVIARYAGGDDGSYAAITSSQAISTLSGFQDASKVSSYARAGMAWCVEAGLVSGYTYSSGLYLKPTSSVARERVATVLYRGLDLLVPEG